MTATLVPPNRTTTQRMAALTKANRHRTARKQLKLDLKRESAPRVWTTVTDTLIATPPPEIATMKVYDLLIACPRIGRVRANRILRAAQCSPSKTLGGLTPRQRHSLRAVVYAHARSYSGRNR